MQLVPNGGCNVRAVLDTNIVVSGFLFGGRPGALIGAVRAGLIQAWTSPVLIAELKTVLARPKFAARFAAVQFGPDRVVNDFLALSQSINPQPLAVPISADPDDDAVLACAIAANADEIVSGDRHLLALGSYSGIPIVTAADLATRLGLP